MTKHSNSDPKAHSDDDEQPIYLHQEGFRHAHPWRLGDYGDKGILQEENITRLITKHGLPEPVTRDLSVFLGYCLSSHKDAAINLAKVSPSKAIERGTDEIERAFASIRIIGRRLSQVDETFAKLRPAPSQGAKVSRRLLALQAQISDYNRAWEEQRFEDACLEILNTPGAVADLSPDDKRKLGDSRRMLVVETCCYAWLEAGKKISVSTGTVGPDTGKRTGRLIDFIQDVGLMIGDPKTRLSGETLKEDIERFEELHAIRTENDKGLGEPTFGPGPVEDVT
jgi:hypothetical protein